VTSQADAFDEALWQRIEGHVIGPAEASLTFTDRLARENRWSRAHAEAVLREYRRFCYLARTAGHPVTPSDAVDQAWHLHLTFSRDYWEVFCPLVLGADLHHGPTAGGAAERARYYEQYAATLHAYEAAFGEAPPPTIWREARRRFEIDPKGIRVNPADAIILPRAAVFGLGLALIVLAFAIGWLLRGIV
jgi:hypothetical protein